jgi:CPA2 family monovalent cation:H+ antiporter-2
MQYFLAAAVLSLMATPALIGLGPRAAAWLERRRTRVPVGPPPAGEPQLSGHVVVVGFGVNGRNLARVLREAGIPYVVIELNGETVRVAKAAGERVVYGDATRRDILEHCGVGRAATVVFAISDLEAVRAALRQARALNPRAHVIVRTRRVAEIDDLYRCGADEVIAEEFETSIEIFTRVLERFHVPANVLRAQTRALRGERYQMMRAPAARGLSARLLDLLAAGATDVYLLPSDSPAAGRTIRDLALREHTGASILAVVRGQTPHPNPAPDLVLSGGDSLVLMGSHAEVDQAFSYLERLGKGTAAEADDGEGTD